MNERQPRVQLIKEHILWSIVCCEKDCTDDEIRAAMPPSGTTAGWARVLRDGDYEGCLSDEDMEMRKAQFPVQCSDNPNRIHVMVGC